MTGTNNNRWRRHAVPALLAAFVLFAPERAWPVNPDQSYLVPQKPLCTFLSLSHPNCTECQSGLDDYSRFYSQGAGLPGKFEDLVVLRQRPYTNEPAIVSLFVKADNDAHDQVLPPAQRPDWAELVFTLNDGETFVSTDSAASPALMMDYFNQETLTPKDDRFKSYSSQYAPWMVSPNNPGLGTTEPAPNRLGTAGSGAIAAFPAPYDIPCIVNGRHTGGLNCPIYDYVYSSDKHFLAGCSRDPGNGATLECNVPGFPIGGGDPMDPFNSVDPGSALDGVDPDPAVDYSGVPGEPMIRVNGVAAVSCDVYPDHILCVKTHPTLTPAELAEKQAIYASHGVYAYTLNATSGVVNFKTALTFKDRVDASYYVRQRNIWSAVFTPEDVSGQLGTPGEKFDLYPKVMDTCGNVITGARATLRKAVPIFDETQGITNESQSAIVGGDDHQHDLIPTDLDPFVAISFDSPRTQCTTGNAAVNTWLESIYGAGAQGGATEAFCGLDFDTNPRSCAQIRAELDAATGAAVPMPTGCECCASECLPTICDFDDMINPNGMCAPIDEDANPPGCGPEFKGRRGMTELNTLKISHTGDNLYLVTEMVGDITYGCISDLPDILGIQGCTDPQGWGGIIPSLDVPSKLNGYGMQLVNQNPQVGGTFVLLTIPEIPIYGEIVLFVDFNALLAGGLGSNLDGSSAADRADGGREKLTLFPTARNGETCSLNDCDPDAEPAADCDADGLPNNTDLCPCASGDPALPSGCPALKGFSNASSADGGFQVAQLGGGFDLDSLTLKDYRLYVSGNKMTLEMLRESSIQALGEYPITAYAMNLTVNIKSLTDTGDIADDLIGRLTDAGGLGPLTSDRSPAVNYYTAGRFSNFEIETARDTSPPEIPILTGCLGRCDEVNQTDGLDNDGDSYIDPIDPARQIDERYNPLSTQIELKWREVMFNDDELRRPLTDLAGYKISYAEGRKPFSQWYDMNAGTGDEPYGANTRFPEPGKYQEKNGSIFSGFGGESISCLFETATETNCINDEKGFPEDGQEFRFRIQAYDNATPPNYSTISNAIKVVILRNTVPPSDPVINTPITPMPQGRSIKVIWSKNPEVDMRGYAVYRCPANPLDAVKIEEGLLPADYCDGDENYRQVNEEPVGQDPGYFIDGGTGYWEGGDSPANPSDPPSYYYGDDDGDWDPAADDVGVDGQAGTGDMGEGDGAPTPGEPHAFEWIDCSGVDSTLCGNFADGATSTLYVAADPDRPVLFASGLVDGYAYYYKVRAIDGPYAGDGYNVPGTCDEGLTRFDVLTQTGCVNPIEDRTCPDARIRFHWSAGGNCSGLSESHFFELDGVTTAVDRPGMYLCRPPQGAESGGQGCKVVPYDANAPIIPLGVKASVLADGTSVNLSWKPIPIGDDPTLAGFQVYRSLDPLGVFSCVHGGCSEAPYAAGCVCDTESDCNDGATCQFPVRICMANENTKAQTVDCNPTDGSKKADGCECSSDDDCISGRSCTYTKKVCLHGDMAQDDGWDNDGDGVIDEELQNSQDDDKDGLVDEDTASSKTTQGACPMASSPDLIACNSDGDEIRACYDYVDDWKREFIPWTADSFTDLNLDTGTVYHYQLAAIDNAKHDFPGDEFTPPNLGNKTLAVSASPSDTQAPSTVIGLCEDDRPCVEVDATTDPSDEYGRSLTVSWLASSARDIDGYKVFRASKPSTSTPSEVALFPAVEQFQLITADLVEHPETALGGETVIPYKDQNLTDGKAYYYYIVVAVDKRGNESGKSDSSAGLQPSDLIPPSAPLWTALYTTRSDCDFTRPAKPSECNATVVKDCVEGSVEPVSQGGMLRIDWAAHDESVCDTTDLAEVDFYSYNIYRTAGKDTLTCTAGDTLVASGVTDTKYTDTGLTNLTQYNYCLTAVDRSGNESEPSEIMSGTPRDAVPPDKPQKFTAVSLSSGQVGLGWLPNLESDLAGYKVYQSTGLSNSSFKAVSSYGSGACTVTFDPDEDPETANDVTVLNCERVAIGGLLQTVTYYFKVAAVDSFGNESLLAGPLAVVSSANNSAGPVSPSDILVRLGFDKRESLNVRTNDQDDDGDGVIDDNVNLDETQFEIHWTRNTEYDMHLHRLYRSETGQNGTYDLTVELDTASVCPTVRHARPSGSESLHTCLYQVQSSDEFPIEAETEYWYLLASVDSEGNETTVDLSNAFQIVTREEADSDPPAVPDKPDALNMPGGESLQVRWCENDPAATENADLASYMVRRDVKRSGTYADIVETLDDLTGSYCQEPCDDDPSRDCDVYCTGSSTRRLLCALDTAAVVGDCYYYKIASVDADANISELSSASSKVCAADEEPPSNASGLIVRPVQNEPNQLLVQWTDAEVKADPGFAGFYLLRNTSQTGGWAMLDPNPDTTANEELFVNTTTFIDKNLDSASSYCYLLQTVDVHGQKSCDEFADLDDCLISCGTPGEDLTPPNSPKNLAAQSLTGRVVLNWNQNSELDLDGYAVYRAESFSGPYSKISTTLVKAADYTDTTGTAEKTYFYKVTAFDTSGLESGGSNVVVGVKLSGSARVVFRVGLKEGWNLVTAPASPSIETGDVKCGTAGVNSAPMQVKGYAGSSAGSGRIAAGEGFWCYADSDGQSVEFEGPVYTDSAYEAVLQKGWNLLGNPYPYAVKWDGNHVSAAEAGTSDYKNLNETDAIKEIVVFNADSQGYEKLSGSIGPGQGVWVNAARPITLRLIGK